MAGGGGTAPKRRGRAASTEDLWQTWWALNRLGFLPDRTAFQRGVVVTPRTGDADPRTLWADRRTGIAKTAVAPFLRRLIDPGSRARDDVVASALIALAKISLPGDDVDLFVRRLEDRRAAPIVRESAALALGLLARSAPARQRPAVELDEIRERLLAATGDRSMPYQARVFAAVALGLLGDQPFAGPYARDGRLVTRGLWRQLSEHHAHQGLNIALLTSLGMQPSAGVPDAVRQGLRAIVTGRRVLGRKWDPKERSHALTAVVRLRGPGADAILARALARKREHVDVRRAAYLAVGRIAEELTSDERVTYAEILLGALKRDRDPLTTGLGRIAVAHLVNADLRDGSHAVLYGAKTGRMLLGTLRDGPATKRSFSALALGVALHRVKSTWPHAKDFVADARALLVDRLETGRGDDRLRAAYAVSVGLAGIDEAVPTLTAIVEDRAAEPALRGHAAVALGQIGLSDRSMHRALFVALTQRRSAELRRQAALGLALSGGRLVGTQLLKELRTGSTEQHLAQVVIALGRLGDLKAVGPLVEYAADARRSELAQALTVVALGMIVDPEPRPVLLRLTQNANYPTRTRALHEAFSIL